MSPPVSCVFTASAAQAEGQEQEHHVKEFLECMEYTIGGHAGHTTRLNKNMI